MVLFSGDGDFRPLVEAVQRKGVRVTVVSTISTQPPMIADELRRQADEFVDLARLQDKVGRDPVDRAARDASREARHGQGQPQNPNQMPSFISRAPTPPARAYESDPEEA
jgi:hypothetical protein